MKRTRLRGFSRSFSPSLVLGCLGLAILLFTIPLRVWLILIGLALLGCAWYSSKEP